MTNTRTPVHKLTINREVVYDRNGIFRKLCSIQIISMFLVTLHSTAMPFLVRIANKTHFLSTTSVFMMEVLKLLFCLIIVVFNSRGIRKASKTLHSSIIVEKLETLKVAVPAVVYAIQNNLYYIALENIDPTTYSVTLQLRILTTAILSVCLLSKKLSWKQWAALFIAMLGVILVQLDKTNVHKSIAGNFLIGILAVLGMCWTSAFAGVYFEKMLKNSKADLWVQNIRLSMLTLFFAGVTMLASDWTKIQKDGMFQGWTWMVWLVTLLNSVGGLCISLVMKYADNVMKTYCQSIAIGSTSIVSIFLGERVLSMFLLYGVFLVISSVVVYSYYPAAQSDHSTSSKNIEYQKLVNNDDDDDDDVFDDDETEENIL